MFEVQYVPGSRNTVCMSKENDPSKPVNAFAGLLVYCFSSTRSRARFVRKFPAQSRCTGFTDEGGRPGHWAQLSDAIQVTSLIS